MYTSETVKNYFKHIGPTTVNHNNQREKRSPEEVQELLDSLPEIHMNLSDITTYA
jgi:hypothetical protein